MTDHAAEAMKQVLDSPFAYGNPAHADVLREAQVHATLALAEQQRIANLIALFAADPTDRTTGARGEFADEAWDHLADDKIRKALGL